MQLQTKTCRCCGAATFQRCGSARMDVFFLKYGLHIDFGASVSTAEKAKDLQDVRFDHVIGYGACPTCEFIAPWGAFSDDMLLDYFALYGTESYKHDRGVLSPGYRNVAADHNSAAEIALRQTNHDTFIAPYLERYFSNRAPLEISLLDYSDGRGVVTPRRDWIDVDIYDMANFDIRSIDSKDTELSVTADSPRPKYDVVQLIHVLQHVGDPRAIVADALGYVKRGGLIYVEVPWEMYDFDRVTGGEPPWCDEHFNKFCEKSLRALVTGRGADILFCVPDTLELLHTPQPARIIKCLAKI